MKLTSQCSRDRLHINSRKVERDERVKEKREQNKKKPKDPMMLPSGLFDQKAIFQKVGWVVGGLIRLNLCDFRCKHGSTDYVVIMSLDGPISSFYHPPHFQLFL